MIAGTACSVSLRAERAMTVRRIPHRSRILIHSPAKHRMSGGTDSQGSLCTLLHLLDARSASQPQCCFARRLAITLLRPGSSRLNYGALHYNSVATVPRDREQFHYALA